MSPIMDHTLVADVRAFNRFYTRLIGALDAGMLNTPYTLTEARLIYEIGKHGRITHGDLSRTLELDPGYLTRLNFKLTDAGVIGSARAVNDRRSNYYALTPEGEAVFAALDEGSDQSIADLLQPLDPAQRHALAGAMRTIQTLLGDTVPNAPLVLRPHRIGELGWLVHRQGILYNQQFGWNIEFEALIAGLYRDFELAPPSPPKALWIAERQGAVVGSIFVTPSEGREGIAQLRMLYVEPEARGLGIGRMLVDQCVTFCRQNGYAKVRLWTQSILGSARSIYAAAGFELVESKPHKSFGHDLAGEIWELAL